MSVGIRAEIFRSLLGDISATLYVCRLVATILYGAKLHNYLECKVIRMDFFELLTHSFFLTEVLKDRFFLAHRMHGIHRVFSCTQRGQRIKGRRGAHSFFRGTQKTQTYTEFWQKYRRTYFYHAKTQRTRNLFAHRMHGTTQLFLTEVHKNRFFSHRVRRLHGLSLPTNYAENY